MALISKQHWQRGRLSLQSTLPPRVPGFLSANQPEQGMHLSIFNPIKVRIITILFISHPFYAELIPGFLEFLYMICFVKTCNMNKWPQTQVQISLYCSHLTQVNICLESPFSWTSRNTITVVWVFLLFPSSHCPGEIIFLSRSLKEKRHSTLTPVLSPRYFVCWSFVVALPKSTSEGQKLSF